MNKPTIAINIVTPVKYISKNVTGIAKEFLKKPEFYYLM
jgi:hypothetical protein